MKTKRFRLLVTMLTLAAVITIGTAPATAQRRTTGVNNTETREQKSNNQQNSSVQNRNNSNNAKASTQENKSANVQNRQATPAQRNTNVRTETTSRAASTQSNTNAQRRETTTQQDNRNQTSPNKSANVQNRQTTPAQRNTNVRTETTNGAGSTQGNTNTQRRETTNPQVNREQTNTNRNTTVNTNTERNRNVETNRNNASTANRPENNATRRSTSTSVSSGGEYSRNVNNPEARRTTENARRIYRLDENDSRYKPNNDFKGSNQYWSQNYRPGNMNYNYNDRNFYRKYDYWGFSHWDRRWETYRWNFYSWRDYYSAYNPYSYRFHRHYVYHPRYGHVIKRFIVRPVIFRHNNISYYCYDGHFFRHLRGVGYVLVDIPFGIAFDILPYDYERVYINGYLYFRVGNLFFERTNFGFSLIHYPERYYALSDDYRNGGYYFDDDIYW